MTKSLAETRIKQLLQTIINATHLDLTCSIQAYPDAIPDLVVELSGPDTPLLTARNAELLRAIEHIAFEIRGLDPSQHDLLEIDADHYKQNRNQALLALARAAATKVQETGCSYAFQPMSSHERRLLHLALAPTGLRTASIGEAAHRAVVLHPAGHSN